MNWIDEVDDMLAQIEGTVKGNEGDTITKVRGIISAHRKEKNNITELRSFCEEHRVEVLLQDDMLFHCFIDFEEGHGSWSVMDNPLDSMIYGMQQFKFFKKREHNENV